MQVFRLLLASAVVAGAMVCLANRSEAASEPACDTKCVKEAPKCCDVCIDYRHRRCCRKVCCECAPPQKATLCVKDPCCCGRAVKVPVCIPSCCKGEPCVSDRCGVAGRGVVTYEWCCGFKLTVLFRKCGDVTVTYFGS